MCQDTLVCEITYVLMRKKRHKTHSRPLSPTLPVITRNSEQNAMLFVHSQHVDLPPIFGTT